MADVDKQNDDHQKQSNTLPDHHISSLIDQIYEQLVCTVFLYDIEKILEIINDLQWMIYCAYAYFLR